MSTQDDARLNAIVSDLGSYFTQAEEGEVEKNELLARPIIAKWGASLTVGLGLALIGQTLQNFARQTVIQSLTVSEDVLDQRVMRLAQRCMDVFYDFVNATGPNASAYLR